MRETVVRTWTIIAAPVFMQGWASASLAGTGACWFYGPECECAIVTPTECGAGGGLYMGDDSTCDPQPCVFSDTEGACCFPDGTCRYLPVKDCHEAFWSPCEVCDPNPCAPVPSLDESWGRIKSRF